MVWGQYLLVARTRGASSYLLFAMTEMLDEIRTSSQGRERIIIAFVVVVLGLRFVVWMRKPTLDRYDQLWEAISRGDNSPAEALLKRQCDPSSCSYQLDKAAERGDLRQYRGPRPGWPFWYDVS
jgi:hypothetical protein